MLLESEGECHIGLRGDVCLHRDVNTSLDAASKFHGTLSSGYLKTHTSTNVDSK